ncbi:MAG TPA: helix-turn-helix domain-containing protein [Ktedonobacterales bacterium]|nr:helix-turn-helix domain-containing protein [Ktedonobacterales bacterium]
MGAVTARDVLALLERRGARLVAGGAGDERPVTWASAMRARPPAFENLQGGELALVSLATLRLLRAQDETLSLERLIQDLAERGVAAIAVAGLRAPDAPATPPATPEADQRAATAGERALADALRLPLLALPVGALLSEVEREVIAFVVAERTAASEPRPEAPRDAYDALMRASLRGDDDRALGQRLVGILGVAIALEDAEDVRWCEAPGDFPLPREALLALLRRPSARAAVRAMVAGAPASAAARIAPLGAGYARALVAPGAGHAEREAGTQPTPAALAAVFPISAPSDASTAPALVEVLQHVAPLFALALARRQDAESAERRLRAEALDALLAGTYPDESRMRLRAAQLGHDLTRQHAALVVELGPPEGAPLAAPPALVRAAEAVAQALAAELPGTWARARGAEVAALVPVAEGTPAGDLAELARHAAAAVAPAAGDVVWAAGMGEAALGPVEVRRSHHEARDTARLGRSLLGLGLVARATDLGLYRLLLRLRESGELEDFTRRTLGPLLADARGAHYLLETLDAYFACNGNHSLAARRLSLHRNSLIYRLNRARALLGYDLDEPEARLALQLALKARRVLAL